MPKEIKKIGLRLILTWIFSIIFIVGGVGIMIDSFFSGIITILAGIIILPPFKKILKEKVNIELSGWLKVIIVLILLVIAGNFLTNDDTTNYNQNSELTIPDNSQQTQDNSNSASKSWYDLTSFKGKDNKNTDTFKIQGNKFKLIYTVNPANDYSLFSIFVYEESNNIYKDYISLDSGTDSSIIYKGPGTFYLDITAANLNSWEVEIEDYY